MRKEYTIEIEYEGDEKEEYKVTTSFKALAMLEERTTPAAIMQQIARHNPRMSDLVWFFYCLIAAAGYKNVTEEKIGEAFNSKLLGVAAAADLAVPILAEWMPKEVLESAGENQKKESPQASKSRKK